MIVTERRKKCLEEFSKTGLDGVLFASPIADAAASLLSLGLVAYSFRTLKE